MTRVSRNYVATLDPMSAVDMQTLNVLRKVVSIMNKNNTRKHRVRVCGRKPINGYDWGGNPKGGLKNATMYDVYVYNKV